MNWEQVSNEYPKSYSKLKEETPFSQEGYVFEDRELYDFFDKKEIYVSTESVSWTSRDEKTFGIRFTGIVLYFDNPKTKVLQKYINEFYVDFPTRSEVEDAAFNKAFKILENRL